MNKLQKKASAKLSDFIFDVKEKIKKSKLVYWDDTVVAIGDKDKACMRVYTDENYVLYKAHMAKDTDGMDEDGILQNLPETFTVMHDHLLHNYCDDYKYNNIECNAHITRKLEGMLSQKEQLISNEIYSFDSKDINEFSNKKILRYCLILQIKL